MSTSSQNASSSSGNRSVLYVNEVERFLSKYKETVDHLAEVSKGNKVSNTIEDICHKLCHKFTDKCHVDCEIYELGPRIMGISEGKNVYCLFMDVGKLKFDISKFLLFRTFSTSRSHKFLRWSRSHAQPYQHQEAIRRI
jgi:hypothetical protein